MGGTDGDSGDIRLSAVLDSIRSKSIMPRANGIKGTQLRLLHAGPYPNFIEDLKTLFDPNKSANTSVLTDKAYHKVYESLFQAALLDKAAFMSAKRNTKATATTRLTACADALRIVVKAGVSKLKPKTVEAVIDHITQTLPTTEDEYCQPLAQHYLKALSIVFEYPPNVEHLKNNTWLEVVDFCVQGINQYTNDHDGEHSSSTRALSGLGTANSSASNNHTQNRGSSMSRQNAEDLLQALHLLISAPTAPIADRFTEVMSTAVLFLQTQGASVSQMHQLAFSIVNDVLSYTCLDQTSFSQSVALDIIPVICRFWQGKVVSKDEMLNSVRDEMLIFLFAVHPHLERSLIDEETEGTLTMLEDLSDILKSDYARRSDRDQLQLDDLEMLDLGAETSKTSPFSLDTFRLRPHNSRAERNWGTLQAIGILERLISFGHARTKQADRSGIQDLDEHPRKRQRLPQSSDRLFKSLKFSDEKSRISGLQILPFILQDCQLSTRSLEEMIEQLRLCASDKRGTIASWALIAIASCTFQKAIRDISSASWIGVWHLGARLLTFSTTCRAAALQLHSILAKKLVDYHSIGDDVNAIITAADVSGPAIICDSAISLMTHLLNARVTEAPGASLVTSQHTIRWLFTRWNPADRSFAAHYAVHVQPLYIANLLRTCLGLHRMSMPADYILPCGRLVQAWEQCLHSRAVIRYLLLLDRTEPSTTIPCIMCPTHGISEDLAYALDSSHFQSTRKLILELLLPKCSGLLQSWKAYTVDRLSILSLETFRSAVYSCITILLSMAHFSQSGLPQLHHLETSVQDFYKEIVAFLSEAEARDPDGIRAFNETLLQCVQPYLPSCGSSGFSQFVKKNSHLFDFLALLGESSSVRRFVITPLVSPEIDDPMDTDDEFSTQQSRGGSDLQKSTVPRRVLALDMSPASFYLVTFEHLLLVNALKSTPDLAGSVPSALIDELVALSNEELLLSRSLVHEMLDSGLTIDISDACRLLQRCGLVLESSEFITSEVALVLCLDVLVGLAHLWSTEDISGDLAGLATDLYAYFYEMLEERALTKHSIAVEVQEGIARLLFLSLQRSPNLGEELSVPSARSNLFNLLKMGPAQVKFYIGDRIPSAFQIFLLEDHDKMIVDILEILPSDPDFIEGISFRLYVLAKLASEWPTLLRRCLYHLFETAGSIPKCLGHTTRCLSDVSSALKLDSAQDLFALFASQLLYTWLEVSEDVKNIPFQIFGFSSLQDLIHDAKGEITGLMMMRGQDEGIQQIAEILQVKEDDLLKDCFAKVMAYTIAYDVSVPPSSSGEKRATGESRVKKRLGQETFFEHINLHFADITALFFSISDPHDNVVKYLSRHKDLEYAVKIMTEIKTTSSSTLRLPPNQQPTFRDRYLFTQIEHLCSRTEFDSHGIYNPALVTFIARKLFDTIHPALGSLHACSVLRRVRALISLAGESAVTGYPLEVFLQTVRPFINDPQCADDAIGIVQYLMTHGSEHLLRAPSFFAGVTLAIFGSLRAFLKAGRASSTQESQHKTTVSRVQEFQKWLVSFLESYDSPMLESLPRKNLRKLLRAASNTEWMGNAESGTPESELLVRLLQDEQITGKLLSKPSRELALNTLCSDFQSPASFRTDILGDDESANANAVVVWKSCKGKSPGRGYISWAGRVLGRAFAASGHTHLELLRESSSSEIRDLSPPSEEKVDSSVCVLSLLQGLIHGYNELHAGLAETALRVIMTTSDEILRDTCRKALTLGLYIASDWGHYQAPPSETLDSLRIESENDPYSIDGIFRESWLRDLTLALARSVPDDILLYALVPIVKRVPHFAEQAFPFIVHLALSSPYRTQHTAKKHLSKAFMDCFEDVPDVEKNNLKVLINAILYLRTQPLPKESSSADRSHWLEIDYLMAAGAATRCGMFKTALLFAEEYCSAPSKSSRRSSVNHSLEQTEMPTELLLTIFQNIDDPDLYYGVKQKANLRTILARSEHERDGPKSLAFRSAQYDSHFRRQDPTSNNDAQALVKALDNLSLSGLSHSLLQAQQSAGMSADSLDSMFRTARKLEQWDLPVPTSCANNAVTIYKAFQSIQTAVDHGTILQALNEGFDCTMDTLMKQDLGANSLHDSLQTLATLVEMDEVLSTQGSEEFENLLTRFQNRAIWMKIGRFDDMSQILSCRGTTLSTLSQRLQLQNLLNVEMVDTRLVEVRTALLASTLNRAHNALQESLSIATYLMDLVAPCQQISLNVDISIQVEAANALWDQGESSSSISMLQSLDDSGALKKQDIPVARSDLLSKIGHQVSEARLEKADQIISNYLKPALGELNGKTSGAEAGQVFHQFAMFCDQQLQDSGGREDLERLRKMRQTKSDECLKLDKMIKTTKSTTERETLRKKYSETRAWLKLDEEELQRHNSNRDQFLGQSLENYLLALAASDEHDSVALRFAALWLEHAEESTANNAVLKHLKHVPSRKLASLMNQLTSRLQSNDTRFQELLFSLVMRICTEHPYHGMYTIFSGTQSKPRPEDEAAISRHKSTKDVGRNLRSGKAALIWEAIISINQAYVNLAKEKDDQKYKSGRKVAVKESRAAGILEAHFRKYRIPPPTMPIPLAADLDYSKIPTMNRLDPVMAIASGVSTPKIITILGSNGARFKQLVKGGHDDLRQDAIMEQVFEQVSELLKSSRSTRQRDLKIRTYKVVPLTANAGIMEFVANTVPLHEYLMPAHERYFPKDLKGNVCRKEIGLVQQKSAETRVKTFRSVAEKFHPVMRYFFTENFTDPDEWFVKRLAYTRTTAAISMLGHVLGLGDRHGHNILLDAQSGEVVHIDLGVAFEAGRILPVPELVPFRLTRDIVDGMGITKTEGVFRRCCEFILEALRGESHSIMAILDVLRYDPLHSWSISPVRIAKLQEGQSAAPVANVVERTKEAVNEPGEAERALTVVQRKLSSGTGNVTATVSDLIIQATDERNLAVLYSGWAAYA
ncbi:Serine/threonine-protein kinase TEL1 [Lachnellula suecica]|uniref:Serine/threonine-protein kinase Tel1 n=1 Tax=Lachnellula suecica TaxID=602035 RepID=A0A8T9CHC4_9HELO|nr:Serine/threonine-protein kinase TEL1 [Lachnellula suecica]